MPSQKLRPVQKSAPGLKGATIGAKYVATGQTYQVVLLLIFSQSQVSEIKTNLVQFG